MSPVSLRVLAPRPASQGSDRDGSPSGTGDPSSASESRSSRRQLVSVACHNCRRRKSKCNGERPCQACVQKNLECEFETEVGQTRSQALKQKNRTLSDDNHDLIYLVDRLRRGTSAEAAELLRRIRSANSAEEVSKVVGEAALLLPMGDTSISNPDVYPRPRATSSPRNSFLQHSSEDQSSSTDSPSNPGYGFGPIQPHPRTITGKRPLGRANPDRSISNDETADSPALLVRSSSEESGVTSAAG